MSAGRSFRQGLTHMAFYADGAIQPEIPAILDCRDNLLMTSEVADELAASSREGDRQFARAISQELQLRSPRQGQAFQVFLLSPNADGQTLKLSQPVANTAVGANGRRVAWTQSQRYVRLSDLKTSPATTTELDLIRETRQGRRA